MDQPPPISRARGDSFRPATPSTLNSIFNDGEEEGTAQGGARELRTEINEDPMDISGGMRRSPSKTGGGGRAAGWGMERSLSSSLPTIREDLGDESDWRRCIDWGWWRGLLGGAGPLVNRVVKDAAAPWQRRFSDAEEAFSSMSRRQRQESGSSSRVERTGSVEDLRRQYISHQLTTVDVEVDVDLIRREVCRWARS